MADAFSSLARHGLVLLGCGKMGLALLEGWLARGLPTDAVSVVDPAPSAGLRSLAARGMRLNQALPERPEVCLLAVKPQTMPTALPQVAVYRGGSTLFLSIAAGLPLRLYEASLGTATPVVRAMPNTPAAIGQGITALIGNKAASDAHLGTADALLSVVGETVRLTDESQMDTVTAVSGSGPAYVFLLIEALADAGVREGLPPDLALRLARATVAGAGALARASEQLPGELRQHVTSPGGTTAAALDVLMAEKGLHDLLRRAVAAAAARGRELAESKGGDPT